ncbi:hypothetical protein RJ641_018509 [Dillenia turbinata]|uniref:Uncharacterized protein n=1 Tax=Dillenia turbinata TaxID=194707 RepID=A0AAN8UXQ6_9MAGN
MGLGLTTSILGHYVQDQSLSQNPKPKKEGFSSLSLSQIKMSYQRSSFPATLLPLFFLLVLTPTPSNSLSFSSYHQWRTLFSLSHALMIRVANLRSSRGDIDGYNRAKSIADKLEMGFGLGFWQSMLSFGWDYLKNYSWREINPALLYGVVSDANQIINSLLELNRLESDSERGVWISRNYKNVFGVSKSLFSKLHQVFRQSGAMREAMETMQREVVEGGLLKDCLELGSKDLKGLVQNLRDLALQFSSSAAAAAENPEL